MTQADIFELSLELHSIRNIPWTNPPPSPSTFSLHTMPSSLLAQWCLAMHVVTSESSSQSITGTI